MDITDLLAAVQLAMLATSIAREVYALISEAKTQRAKRRRTGG